MQPSSDRKRVISIPAVSLQTSGSPGRHGPQPWANSLLSMHSTFAIITHCTLMSKTTDRRQQSDARDHLRGAHLGSVT